MSFHNFQDIPDEEVALEIELKNITNKKGNSMASFNEMFAAKKAAQANVEVESFEEKGSIGSGGSSFKIENDGVYVTLIDMVTFHQSASSEACWYEITLKTEVGQKVKTKLFVTNKDGDTFSIDKNGNKKVLAGNARMGGLNFLINGEWDGMPVPEEKEIMVYNHSQGGEVAKVMPIVTSLIGKPVAITVKMIIEDGYPDAMVSRTTSDIRNFLDPVTMKSATEKRNGSEATVVKEFKEAITKSSEPIDKRDKSKGGKTATTDATKPKTGFGFTS